MPSCRFCKIIGLPLQPPVLRSSGGFCCIHGCDLSCSISCGGVTNGVAHSKVAVTVQRCLAAWLPPALSNLHKLGSCKGNTRRLLLQPCPCGLSGLLTMQFLFIRLLLKPSDFCLRLFRCLFGAQHQCCQVLRPGALPFLRFAWLLGSVPCGGDLQVSRLAFSGHW